MVGIGRLLKAEGPVLEAVAEHEDVLAAPEGVARMKEAHPDVPIITAALDDHLNEKGYIVPGLGDAGDRMYGTK